MVEFFKKHCVAYLVIRKYGLDQSVIIISNPYVESRPFFLPGNQNSPRSHDWAWEPMRNVKQAIHTSSTLESGICSHGNGNAARHTRFTCYEFDDVKPRLQGDVGHRVGGPGNQSFPDCKRCNNFRKNFHPFQKQVRTHALRSDFYLSNCQMFCHRKNI